MSQKTESTKPLDGFLTPEGEFIAVDDAVKMIPHILGFDESPAETKKMLWAFSLRCLQMRSFPASLAYGEKAVELEEDPQKRAGGILCLGSTAEKAGDFGLAATVYKRAFELPQSDNDAWYFLNNNLGFCLNQLVRNEEAEGYCRSAISINPARHNAHKNLGISLEGLGRIVESAECYLTAAELCPQDPRALALLKKLVAQHSDILQQEPRVWGSICARLGSGECWVH